MSRHTALFLLAALLVFLLVGTLMPFAWRQSIESGIHAPSFLPSLAHFITFACITLVLRLKPLGFSVMFVSLAALGLGLATEGLQFFAIDRHPRWVDVGIDLAGAIFGLCLSGMLSTWFARR